MMPLRTIIKWKVYHIGIPKERSLIQSGTVVSNGRAKALPFFYLSSRKGLVWLSLDLLMLCPDLLKVCLEMLDVCPKMLKRCGPRPGPTLLTTHPFPYRSNDIYFLYFVLIGPRMSQNWPYGASPRSILLDPAPLNKFLTKI